MKINARNKKKDFKDASTNGKKMTEKKERKVGEQSLHFIP